MFKRSYLPEYIFLALVAGILIYQLLIPPIVGLANSGDFGRLMQPVGLSFQTTDHYETHFLFVNREFNWDQSLHPQGYLSSELLFLAPSVIISGLTNDGVFDIRVLGAVHILALLLVLILLTTYTAKLLSCGSRILLYAMILLMFTDVGYVAYFNSLYAEPSSFIFLCATIAFMLAFTAHEKADRLGIGLLTGFFISAALFITSKTQNSLIGIPLAVLCYALSKAVVAPKGKHAKKLGKTAVAFTVGMVIVSLGYSVVYVRFSDKIRPTNLYNVVFYEILNHSPNPEADATALGLDNSAAKYKGSQQGTVEIPADLQAQIQNLTYTKVLRFYMARPGRLIDVSARCARETFSMRPPYLGNFEMTSELINEANTKIKDLDRLPNSFYSHSFSLWSTIKEHIVPKRLWFVALFILLNAAVAAAKWIRYDKTSRDKMISGLHITLVVAAVLQFFIVVVGEGEHEVLKHLFLFNLLCEVCLIFLVMYVVSGITAPRRPKTKEAAGTA